MLCGGTSETKDATDEIQALIDTMADRVESRAYMGMPQVMLVPNQDEMDVRPELEAKVGKSFPKYKAISYSSQVVAGTNFFVKVQLDENDFVHVRIFRSLPHAGSTVTVHSHQTGKTKDDPVAYF